MLSSGPRGQKRQQWVDMGLRGPGVDSRRAGLQENRELAFTQRSMYRWNRVNGPNGDAGLGPKAGLQSPKAAWAA